MVNSLLKTLIVIIFASGLFYCANLAFLGDLKMLVIMEDANRAITYIKELLN